jgi:hypothetical protein
MTFLWERKESATSELGSLFGSEPYFETALVATVQASDPPGTVNAMVDVVEGASFAHLDSHTIYPTQQ